jgi:hypothetical protein
MTTFANRARSERNERQARESQYDSWLTSQNEARKVRTAFAACRSDACRQGDRPCPTPDACELPEPSRFDSDGRELLWFAGAMMLVGLACVVAFFWWPEAWT